MDERKENDWNIYQSDRQNVLNVLLCPIEVVTDICTLTNKLGQRYYDFLVMSTNIINQLHV